MAIEHASVDEASPLQTVHIIGQTANFAAGSSIRAQAAEILDRIDALLAMEGTDKSELIQANIWLRDLGSFAEMNAAWEQWVTPGITPRRTTFEEHGLPALCDLRVDVIAWRKSQEFASS
ncbi:MULTISPECIES: Rid family hydrolase [unclassified Rhizobium]|uniref:Rid family hydrolase n=1 Tax=unclassified Rhizobium TaxID=2613769 RepID=UPI00160A1A48|nr:MULTISPECIES: Rid family hydrolase [unclassified Rhizobium]MBB3541463.1 enamine deaminase RidA (YjgF/YER057c/UK114 family) [Rhizobium sp. BK399]MCS3740187.1 enamine deaminase RidA (YjgF/YER057c/UK114 family) [Rhizobium sp. BK661]MCS4091863.1 enamine deaminase RidA (YjgF/YER057c/UK114 family) [Rhizobium sp. BK176]